MNRTWQLGFLFLGGAALVAAGFAGEDDLDAPDLGPVPNPAEELPRSNEQASASASDGA